MGKGRTEKSKKWCRRGLELANANKREKSECDLGQVKKESREKVETGGGRGI